MSVLDKLAHAQGRRDEVPNQELAKELAANRDDEGIKAIIDGLNHKERNIQNDCIKVAYEIGYIAPELIAAYADEFIALLTSRNNRLVWGAMIALSTIAPQKADDLFQHKETILKAFESGSVITQDSGIKTLAVIAHQDENYRRDLFPILLDHLETCHPKYLPNRAAMVVDAVDPGNRQSFINVIESRKIHLKPSQLKRLNKVLRDLQG